MAELPINQSKGKPASLSASTFYSWLLSISLSPSPSPDSPHHHHPPPTTLQPLYFPSTNFSFSIKPSHFGYTLSGSLGLILASFLDISICLPSLSSSLSFFSSFFPTLSSHLLPWPSRCSLPHIYNNTFSLGHVLKGAR